MAWQIYIQRDRAALDFKVSSPDFNPTGHSTWLF